MRRLLHHALALAWLALTSAAMPTALTETAPTKPGRALRPMIPADAVRLAAGQPTAPASAWKVALESEDSVPDPSPPPATGSVRFASLRPAAPAPSGSPARPAPIPILLLTQRQNE